MKWLGKAAELLGSLGLNTMAAVAFRNRIVNGNFSINQRKAASASTSYPAGTYVMDRWKAGPNGCTLSWSTAANGDVTVSITAGTLMQVIEGGLYLPEGGTCILSWIGTATARIYQGSASGSYAASPVSATALSAGTNATVEFSTGTVSLAQFEPGTVTTVFERRDDELFRCQRYCATGSYYILLGSAAGGYFCMDRVRFPVPMRAIPTVTASALGGSNSSGIMTDQPQTDGFMAYVAAGSAGNVQSYGTYAAAADL